MGVMWCGLSEDDRLAVEHVVQAVPCVSRGICVCKGLREYCLVAAGACASCQSCMHEPAVCTPCLASVSRCRVRTQEVGRESCRCPLVERVGTLDGLDKVGGAQH